MPERRIAVAVDAGGQRRGDRFELEMAERRAGRRRQARRHTAGIPLLPGNRVALAIGIGVNVVAHPEDVPYPATSLKALGLCWRRRDACSWRCPTPGTRMSAIWNSGARARLGYGSAGWRALPGSDRKSPCGSTAMSCAASSRQSTRIAASSSAPAAAVVKIAAGDVHFGAVASAGAA